MAAEDDLQRARYIHTDPTTQLSVEEFGDAKSGRAIILISGAGAPAAYWPNTFCESLSECGFKVVRFDHRDTGYSTHFDKKYSIEVLIRDTECVVAATSACEYHLVGHSMGGYIVAMMLTDLKGKNIKTGTAISAGPTSDTSQYESLNMSQVSQEVWSELEGAPVTGDYAQDLPTWLKTWRFMNGRRNFHETLAINYTKALHKGDIRNRQVAVNHIHAMTTLPTDLPNRLAEIETRLLVIHGSADRLVPFDNGEALTRLTPTAQLFTLDGAGHMFFSDDVWLDIETILLDAINSQSPELV